MKLTDTELSDLETKAKAATPGPWQTDCEGIMTIVRGADATIVAKRHRLPAQTHAANFKHIAAANPATVLRLIEEVRQLRGKA